VVVHRLIGERPVARDRAGVAPGERAQRPRGAAIDAEGRSASDAGAEQRADGGAPGMAIAPFKRGGGQRADGGGEADAVEGAEVLTRENDFD
jgi:hypothetical protein